MEKRFAVEFEYTKERYKDCYKYIFWGSSFAFLGYALAVICVLGIILSVAVKEYLSISYFVWCLVIVAGVRIGTYFRAINITYKRDTEMNGGQPKKVIFSVSDEGIYLHRGGEESLVRFESFKSAKRTPRYLFAKTKSKIVFVFPTECFTLGDIDSLSEFLKSKGIKVK